ncbi:hypothetical protein SAMN05444682_102103 [Parapedobacter indicus]|uniref:Uncharacterized protein n=2 Tax=Parapedobacter indicus TaxID=1477437 RepID=A0A1I3F0D5_9SPHI|nr:hypothetical protein CLV26_102103 [Parapedobacter indicus]SFI04646.1 hypothetical protein SAMN05444682_102103 [Parapedobacter indicus]
MKVAEERVVQLNYEDTHLSINVRELRPVVFESKEGYFCVLGPDIQTGIVGSGNTIREALASWETALERRTKKSPSEEDEVALYVRDVLQASNNDVW